jgi:hypothetical protein
MIRAAIHLAEKEANRRFDEFVRTVRRALQAPEPMQKSVVVAYIESLESALEGLPTHSRNAVKPFPDRRRSP